MKTTILFIMALFLTSCSKSDNVAPDPDSAYKGSHDKAVEHNINGCRVTVVFINGGRVAISPNCHVGVN